MHSHGPERLASAPRPLLAHERVFVGVDIGKNSHVAGFVSTTLLASHTRFEACPSLNFAQSREGFAELVKQLAAYTYLEKAAVLLESTGHYHRALEQYLLEEGIEVYVIHVQRRSATTIKSDKRDALALANLLYNQLEKEIQVTDKKTVAHRSHKPSPVALRLKHLVRHRYELSHEVGQRRNKLTSICDELFPEFSRMFKNVNLPTALSIRAHFPTPAAVAKASLLELRAAKVGERPSDARLLDLQKLAAASIGTRDPDRIFGLQIEQGQLIAELQLAEGHLEDLDAEIARLVEGSREGQIITSIPIFGTVAAATLIAAIGSIDNFASAAALKSYLGWAPMLTQTGSTIDTTTLTRGGARTTRHLLFMVAMNAVRLDCEWKLLYERLVPLKCAFDNRTGKYRGKLKVIGRIAGQMTEMIFMLLKRDAASVAAHPVGEEPPPPKLYDRSVHKAHREGGYRPAKPTPPTPPGAQIRPLRRKS